MRLTSERDLRLALFAGTSLVAIVVALVAYVFGGLGDIERQSLDERFSLRGSRSQPKDIVIVALDDGSIQALSGSMAGPALSRFKHAAAIDHIAAGRPAAIAYDFEFEDYSTIEHTRDLNTLADNALYTAVRDHAPLVVLAASKYDKAKHLPDIEFDPAQIGARAGSVNFDLDRAGVIRRFRYADRNGLEEFAIAASEAATHRTIDPSEFHGHAAWIDFSGPPRTFRIVPFARMLRSSPKQFAGKVVVVGATASDLQDRHATPTGASMSGAEVEANSIWTVLHGFPLRSVPGWVDVFLIVLLGLVPAALGVRFRPAISLPATVGVGVLYALFVQFAFDHGRVVSFIYPLTALGLAMFGALFAQYALASFERQRVRDVFARFVPEQVVDAVLAQAEGDLRLGGRSADATVMFADLRGFTTTSEKLDAAAVIQVLNQYLNAMSEAILNHGGTLVSYEGDGINAVFGAPIEQDDHADRAVAAAREMLTVRLPEFNEWVREHGLDPYAMGIGLNTGPVMTGNVGHERRVEYTAVGDTVNTASRIEEMTKLLPFQALVADATVSRLAGPRDDLVLHGEVEVRGREQTLVLWGLGPKSAGPAGERVGVENDRAPAT